MIEIKMVQVGGRHFEVSFLTFIINYLMFLNDYMTYFLYQALLIQLDLSVSVFVLLEHPTVFRENVANKTIILISSNNHF